MQPINFPQANKHLEFSGGQKLDFFRDELTETIIMLWQFTPEELAKIAETGQIYISQKLGDTAFPMLEVPFREITDEERGEIEKKRKQAKVLEGKQNRRPKSNAKLIKLPR